jgi:predicted Zn finger-like uncharacterized protein
MRFGCPHCGASYHVKDRSRLEKAGGKVRVTAQLIDALSGYHLFSERYDR